MVRPRLHASGVADNCATQCCQDSLEVFQVRDKNLASHPHPLSYAYDVRIIIMCFYVDVKFNSVSSLSWSHHFL